MLSQEELDKLLEEGAGANAATPGDAGKPPANDDLDWSAAFAEAAAGGDQAAAKAMKEKTAPADGPKTEEGRQKERGRNGGASQTPSFQELSQTLSGPNGGKGNLDLILDIPLTISVELGRARLQIRELLALGQGAVVPLDKEAGEPAEIYVNQRLMAKGEVVVINDKFGIRLTEIISPVDRVKNLG
ncbi:MAG: flagellar motor switch protein FliN [Deltaproteobacteria bacterium]